MALECLESGETSKVEEEGTLGDFADSDRRKIRKNVEFKEGKEGRTICRFSAQ